MLRALLKSVVEEGSTLSEEQAYAAVIEMLQGEASDLEIASLLTALSTRVESADELAGFARALRTVMQPLPFSDAEREQLIDTCGTGGDGQGTFNISTGAALVAAAAGARVAKHGNRGVTSKCGSADVLEELGVPFDLDPAAAVECLRATGFTFLYAPALHRAMGRVQPVRRVLGFRTIFNIAGPLTNPAGARAQIMGVFSSKRVGAVSEAMAKLGVRHALVVHGADGLDEISLSGTTDLAEVRERSVRLFRIAPELAGLNPAPVSALAGGSAARNAEILEAILRGSSGPPRDVVLLNAAAALYVSGMAQDLIDGAGQAADAIDSGAGMRLLKELREFKRAAKPASRPEAGSREPAS